jgi:PTS system nitrogen regulatory IIA component
MCDGARLMNLEELIGPDRVAVRVRAADKAALIGELGRRAGAALGLPPTAIVASLAAREALGSTGVGNGIAVPHARLDGLTTLAGFFLRLDRAIDFDAIDGRPVDLVFLLLSPSDGPGAHLSALAAVSRRLRTPNVVAAIRAAPDAATVRTALTADAGGLPG